jgi:hypothetical protein
MSNLEFRNHFYRANVELIGTRQQVLVAIITPGFAALGGRYGKLNLYKMDKYLHIV